MTYVTTRVEMSWCDKAGPHFVLGRPSHTLSIFAPAPCHCTLFEMNAIKAPDRTLPRRVSATKAQQSFAEQFGSDDSDEGTTDGQGASATRHLRVSVRRKDNKRVNTLLPSASTEDVKQSGHKDMGKAMSPFPEAVSSPMLPSMTSMSAGSSIRSPPHPVSKRSGPPLSPLTIVTEPQPLEDEMSPLTSLSSFSEEGSPLTEIPEPPPKSFLFPGSVSAPPIPLATRTSRPFPGSSKVSAWSLPKVGSYGWVLVDKRTFKVYDPERHDASEAVEKLWWPAKVCRLWHGRTICSELNGPPFSLTNLAQTR